MDFSTIEKRMSYLLETGIHSDITFILRNGETLKGHKLIFAIASPVFDAMMFGGLPEASEVKIEDVEPEAFKTMTKCIYTNIIELDSVKHAMSVFKAGDKYNLPYLEETAEEFISNEMKSEDVLNVLEFAKLYNKVEIKDLCKKRLKQDTFNVMESKRFLECDLTDLELIVNEDRLEINEIQLFEYIEKWVDYQVQVEDLPMNTVRPYIENVIKKVRFLSMTPSEFISSPFKSELLSDKEKISLLANLNAYGSTPLPNGFSNSLLLRNSEYFSSDQVSFSWHKTEVSKLDILKDYFSPSFYLKNFEFYICLSQETLDDEKYLGVFLVCDGEKIHGRSWSCNVGYSFKLFKKGKQVSTKTKSSRIYQRESKSWGWKRFLKWDLLTTENTIKKEDDCVLIKVDVKLKE